MMVITVINIYLQLLTTSEAQKSAYWEHCQLVAMTIIGHDSLKNADDSSDQQVF